MPPNTDEIMPAPKILLEFSLTPDSKETLQHFMDTNLDALRKNDPVAKKELRELITGTKGKVGTFPKEALIELDKIFRDESEYTLLIRNGPERTGIELLPDPMPEDTYSYYMGNALLDIQKNIKPIQSLAIRRASHRTDISSNYDGLDVLHRDSRQWGNGPVGEYVIFSAPHNQEDAVIEIVALKRAIESLPDDVREKVRVNLLQKYDIKYPVGADETPEPCNLNRVLELMTDPKTSKVISDNFIIEVKLAPPSINWDSDGNIVAPSGPSKDDQMFLDAINTNGIKVNLQGGDLLVVNEKKNIFHRGHGGDSSQIDRIPAHHFSSRVVVNTAAYKDTSL